MLNLSRNVGQWVTCKHQGKTFKIHVVKIGRKSVELSFDADLEFEFMRGELTPEKCESLRVHGEEPS